MRGTGAPGPGAQQRVRWRSRSRSREGDQGDRGEASPDMQLLFHRKEKSYRKAENIMGTDRIIWSIESKQRDTSNIQPKPISAGMENKIIMCTDLALSREQP